MCVYNGVEENVVYRGQPEARDDDEPNWGSAPADAASSRTTPMSTVRSSQNVNKE